MERKWISYSPGTDRRARQVPKDIAPWLVSQPTDEVRVVFPGTRRVVDLDGLPVSALQEVVDTVVNAHPDGVAGVRSMIRRPTPYVSRYVQEVYALLKETRGLRIEDVGPTLGFSKSTGNRQHTGRVKTTVTTFRALLDLLPETVPQAKKDELLAGQRAFLQEKKKKV